MVAWGDVPNWIAALAALLAVMFAWLAARHTRGLLQQESDRDLRTAERDEQEAASRRRAQADLVSAWVVVRVDEEGVRSDGYLIRNLSQSPVYDVRTDVTDARERLRPRHRLAMLPPGEYYVEANDGDTHWEFPDPVASVRGWLRPVLKKPEWRVDRLEFTDSGGRRWSRDAKGRLGVAEAASVSPPREGAPDE
ncbi:hypothetical protein [Cellulosimicrobium cellulans]|uniref:hypothetical protein n=1 Tax=Cellulosimicrobium cellulans TaxID=1710 RepID=UPI001BAA9AD2|nr:hypothetical protein [Cellulosimicrobium cellulans]QUB99518.1 hypothetical protein J5A69_17810 [Cellulosimicrobium cellulans]